MIVTGVVLAGCAALTHTAIDTVRKYAATTLGVPNEGLVTVPALLDTVFACSWVYFTGRWQGVSTIKHPQLFATATVASSLLLLLSRFMYQKAIQLSPLSLTIPYLAFTPAILIATAYFFLGELPGPSGLAGVSVVALGGYLLNVRAGAGTSGGVKPGDGPSPSQAAAAGAAGAAGAVGAGTAAAVLGSTAAAAAGLLLQRSASSNIVPDLEAGSGGGSSKRLLGAKGSLHRRVSSAADLLWAPSILAWQQEPGTLLMIGVAFIWSITASLDKLGVITGPSIWVYFAVQRLAIGVASLAYILATAPRLLLLLRDQLPIMLVVSALELAAVVLFLNAVRHLLVSYVVAIKRCNVLFSVLLGAALFRENIQGRLPYVVLMMAGVCLIVLEPGAHTIVHSHNHRLGS